MKFSVTCDETNNSPEDIAEGRINVEVNVKLDPVVPVEPLPKIKKKRGFAAMSREQVSAIASKGGKAAHAAGTAHQFTTEEAQAAGKKGGKAPHVRRGKGPGDKK